MIFLGKPYHIATQFPTTKFQQLIRINNFPTFVTSKAVFDTKRINAYGTEWFVKILLCKYCQTNNKYIDVTSSPDQLEPETLAAFVCGIRSDRKECSFDVGATFKFKQSDSVQQRRYFHRFCFDSTKDYYDWGYLDFVRIDVIFALFYFCQLF